MRIAVGSDSASELTEALVKELTRRGVEISRCGPLERGEEKRDWPLVAADVANEVATGSADEGIVCCWTGTGVSIAANKVAGIRAALIGDAETARGARIYNHANVLALSLRATTVPIMLEIVDAWFSTPVDSDAAQTAWNIEQVQRVAEMESLAVRPIER
jgi:ribose 5-phosphate isomerase B